MIRTKPRTSRTREMREDLSILMGIQQAHKIQKVYPKSGGPNHRSSTMLTFTRNQQSSPEFFDNENNISSMFLPPPLVTPAACQAARMERMGNLKPRNSRWPICSSQPVTRIENTNPDGFRQPISFMLDCVQQPPTPFGMGILISSQNQNDSAPTSTSAAPSYNLLLQSPWVNRADLNKASSSTTGTPLAEVTSKYSVKQLIDSLCGDGPEIPEILELFPRKQTYSSGDDSPQNQVVVQHLF